MLLGAGFASHLPRQLTCFAHLVLSPPLPPLHSSFLVSCQTVIKAGGGGGGGGGLLLIRLEGGGGRGGGGGGGGGGGRVLSEKNLSSGALTFNTTGALKETL